MDGSGTWRATTPRAVWVMTRGRGLTPLPAWPGILLGWKHADPDPPRPAAWMGLVAFSRESGAMIEMKWIPAAEIQPIAEAPPILGG
ncbi:hypothetical protein JCM18899A_19000 [Nocardioides sp. AN3]